MTQEYKGFTIPAYADTADAPKAFQDFTDDGPIPRFANASARDTAIATPVTGQMCYVTALDEFQYYDGASWVVPWVAASSLVEVVYFSEIGSLSSKTGAFRWYAPYNLTIQRLTLSLGTASSSGNVEIDAHKTGGASIFTTQSNRPICAASTNFDASGTPDVTSMTKDTDYLRIDIDAAGTGSADATVGIEFVRA